MKRNLSVVLIAMALLAGCSRVSSRPDAQVASDVQNKINGDSSIPDKQLNINANNGVVTLTGTVASDAAVRMAWKSRAWRNSAAHPAVAAHGHLQHHGRRRKRHCRGRHRGRAGPRVTHLG